MKAEGFLPGQSIYIFLLWLVAFSFRSFNGILYVVFSQRGSKDLYRVGRYFRRPHGREGLPKGGSTGLCIPWGLTLPGLSVRPRRPDYSDQF